MLSAIAILAFRPNYTIQKLDGFQVVVENRLLNREKPLWNAVRTELHRQLLGINRVIPKPALAKLQKVPVYIHLKSPETQCMAYHPSAQWLREHKMNPDMARAIEIGNAETFLSWTLQQPWMVLHELAHAYHDRFLTGGFENGPIKVTYQASLAKKRYDAVLHGNGGTEPHYAKTNPMEYFAEATEAYFGQNDFYPFVNAELQAHDPETYALMRELWNLR
jgi:hypothetical protein